MPSGTTRAIIAPSPVQKDSEAHVNSVVTVKRPIFQARERRALSTAALLSIVLLISLLHVRALAQEQSGASEFVKNARNPRRTR